MSAYPDFWSFIEEAVLPLVLDNPGWQRLDGRTSGGNRDTFGSFRHFDAVWIVHADTHIEPLMLAAGAASEDLEPFVRRPSGTGERLDLIPDLQKRKKDPSTRHLYIYRRQY